MKTELLESLNILWVYRVLKCHRETHCLVIAEYSFRRIDICHSPDTSINVVAGSPSPASLKARHVKFASVSKLTDSMKSVASFSSGSRYQPRSHLKPDTLGRPGSKTKQVMDNACFFITCRGSYVIEAGPGLSAEMFRGCRGEREKLIIRAKYNPINVISNKIL